MLREKTYISLHKATLWHFCNRNNLFWMNDPETTKYLKKRGRFTITDALKYYLQHVFRYDMMFAIFANEEHIGNCGLFNLVNGTAELRLLIGKTSIWNKGIGGEVVNQLISIAAKSNIHTLWLYVDPKNISALNLYKKKDFIYIDNIQMENVPLQIKMVKQIK